MTQRTPQVLLDGGSFFEAPRWRDGRWWVSDFHRHVVQTVTPEGAVEEVLSVPEQPSGLGWLPDGDLLVVSMRDQRVLRRGRDGSVTEHADLSAHCGGHANDMVVDARGRAWVGNFGFAQGRDGRVAATSLVRVDPDGTVTPAADGLLFPNGAVVTPDGRTLVVGETFGCRYTAFDVADDGGLTGRRTWADLGAPAEPGTPLAEVALAFAPDGCTLDAEGHLWSADAVGGRCARLAPGGAVVDQVRMPEGLQAFACMLGGPDGRTLLVCAAPDSSERRRREAREAVLLTVTVDVPHAGLP